MPSTHNPDARCKLGLLRQILESNRPDFFTLAQNRERNHRRTGLGLYPVEPLDLAGKSNFVCFLHRPTKGAIKLPTGLDADGYLPAFMDIIEGKTHEIQWAKPLQLPPGSCVIFDRGFTDYSWYQKLFDNKIFFVTRLKKNAVFEHLSKRRGMKSAHHIKQDQTIPFRNTSSSSRLICSVDQQTGKEYHFLTNSFDLKAAIIAEMYKERWKIELFFKWIKQNLKVKTFLGTTPNAVLTQLWIGLCVYLLLAYLKFRARLGQSLTEILRLLRLNLFERRDLIKLFKPPNIQ